MKASFAYCWTRERTQPPGEGGRYSSALQGTSFWGRDSIVRMLLAKGVDVNMQGKDGGALQAASGSGRENTVRLPLENGADVNM